MLRVTARELERVNVRCYASREGVTRHGCERTKCIVGARLVHVWCTFGACSYAPTSLPASLAPRAPEGACPAPSIAARLCRNERPPPHPHSPIDRALPVVLRRGHHRLGDRWRTERHALASASTRITEMTRWFFNSSCSILHRRGLACRHKLAGAYLSETAGPGGMVKRCPTTQWT